MESSFETWGLVAGRRVATSDPTAAAMSPRRSWSPCASSSRPGPRPLSDPAYAEELGVALRNFVGRPTPVTRARRLSERLGIELYLKREDLCHTGAHKINNALGQGLLAQRMGKRRIVAETGAGQHGVATATVCAWLGLECVVYMGTEDMARQAPNVRRMQLLGAEVRGVDSGSRTLKDAINEAMRDWVTNVRTTYYLLGSALGAHPYPAMVRDLQKVIGIEARRADRGAGGASSRPARGLCRRRVQRHRSLLPLSRGRRQSGWWESRRAGVGRCRVNTRRASSARRPKGAPPAPGWVSSREPGRTCSRTRPATSFPRTRSPRASTTRPWVRSTRSSTTSSACVMPTAVTTRPLAAFRLLAETEGIIPALESSHALGYVVREADSLRGQVVLLNLSGRGDKDLGHPGADGCIRREGRGGAVMTRIGRRFEKLRAEGKKAFVAFLTAGDPSLDQTVELALALDGAGVDVLELGVPFSDPLADGPVIQRSSERALSRGVTLGSSPRCGARDPQAK